MSDGWGDDVGRRSVADPIGDNLRAFIKASKQVEDCVGKIGTAKDDEKLRKILHDSRTSATALAKSTILLLRQQQGTMAKAKYDKLLTQYNKTLEHYQAISQQAARKEREFVIKIDEELSRRESNASLTGDGSLIEMQLAVDAKFHDTAATEYALQVERRNELRELEQDLNQLAGIYQDAAKLVDQQGEQIDNIEIQVSQAVAHTDKGVEEIKEARKYQKKSRKKMCCLLITFIAIAIAVALPLILMSLKKKDDSGQGRNG